MPSTVADVFSAAGLVPAGPVRWGTPVPETAQGVYVVALTDDPASTAAALPAAPFDRGALEHLLTVRPDLRLDLARPDTDDLIGRLGAFWLPEVVLYIGRAGQPLRRRVGQYYKTPLGAPRPHAGGWWLQTLLILDELRVYWAGTPDYARAEKRMLQAFAGAVSPESRATLFDSERVMPFANLRGYDNAIKEHHVTGATGSRPAPTTTTGRGKTPARSASQKPRLGATSTTPPQGRRSAPGNMMTQRVSATDLAAGRIRVPRQSKALLPNERGDVTVMLGGVELRARWDPRFGPPERSGVLAFGRGKLDGRVQAGEVLSISTGTDERGDVRLS